MQELEVNCITKPSRENANEHITHVGNTIHRWRLTRETVIERIESKAAAYYTVDRQTGQKSYIGVVRSPNRAPYLRTYADGKWNDNLVALVACGANCSVMG